jgi:hypothetical protein
MALVGLNLLIEYQQLKAVDTIAYEHYRKALTTYAPRRKKIGPGCSQR